MTGTQRPGEDRGFGGSIYDNREFVTIVRAAVEGDLGPLTDIWFEGWHDAHALIVPKELVRLRTRENFYNRLRAELHAVRVVDRDGAAAGFTMLRAPELYQFYVAAHARGAGVATVLMVDAEARLAGHGADVAWLDCAIGNTRAARFYEKCGWHCAATVTSSSDTPAGPFALDVWRYEKVLLVR
jgi:GNAT superfamily N-acetyltransferase